MPSIESIMLGLSLTTWKDIVPFLADRTNGRAYATVLRLSVVVVCLSVCL